MSAEINKGRKPFKFANVLTTLPQFQGLVSDFWGSTAPLFISTSALFRLSKKLKGLKPLLRNLGKSNLADISGRTKESLEDLSAKQQATLFDPTSQRMAEEKMAYEKWTLLSGLEEGFLKQKSKLHWLNVGDQNTKYFHQTAEVRKMQNSLQQIINP